MNIKPIGHNMVDSTAFINSYIIDKLCIAMQSSSVEIRAGSD